MSGPFTIRRFEPDDESAIARLMAELQDFERELSADRPPGEQVGEPHFRYLLDECRQKQGRVYVAEVDRVLVGFIVVLVEQLDDGDEHLHRRYRAYGDVTDLFVAPAYRGQGIAGALLKKAEDHCRSLSLSRLRLEVLADNRAARDFYRRAGYEEHALICITEL